MDVSHENGDCHLRGASVVGHRFSHLCRRRDDVRPVEERIARGREIGAERCDDVEFGFDESLTRCFTNPMVGTRLEFLDQRVGGSDVVDDCKRHIS